MAESQPWNLHGRSSPWLVTLLRRCVSKTPRSIEPPFNSQTCRLCYVSSTQHQTLDRDLARWETDSKVVQRRRMVF